MSESLKDYPFPWKVTDEATMTRIVAANDVEVIALDSTRNKVWQAGGWTNRKGAPSPWDVKERDLRNLKFIADSMNELYENSMVSK